MIFIPVGQVGQTIWTTLLGMRSWLFPDGANLGTRTVSDDGAGNLSRCIVS